LAIHLVERAGDLQRPGVARKGSREHAQMGVADGGVREVLARAALGDRTRLGVHRQGLVRSAEAHDPTRGQYHLRRPLGAAEGRRRRGGQRPAAARAAVGRAPVSVAALRLAGTHAALRQPSDRAGALAQRVVDLAAELGPDAEVDRAGGDHHHDRHGDRRRGRYAGPQAHGSRRT
jgi:hypothetical protein